MKDKVFLVTGGTSGIGKEAARAFAALGANVVIAGRSKEKAERTREWIQTKTGNTNVDFVLGDFASLNAVRELAAEFQARYNRLDVLVNNAGAFFIRRQKSQDGYEKTLAVNHLAPFLLTHLLLDLLKNSAPSRIINVSSNAHLNATMDFDNLEYTKNYQGMPAYGRSKLANVLFTYELAPRLAETGVTVNAVHPGFIATNIGADNLPGVLGRMIKWVINLGAKPIEEGTDTIIYLAASPEVAETSGKYFVRRKATPSSRISYDTEAAKKLWELSLKMVGL